MRDRKDSGLLLLNLNHIGDILFTTPAIRAIRETFPEVHITAVVGPGMGDVLWHNPCLDEVLVRERHSLEILRLRARFRKHGIETSVLFSFSSMDMAAAGRLSGAKVRVGFDVPKLRAFLNKRVALRRDCHVVESYLDLARALGAVVKDPKIEMHVGQEDRKAAERTFEAAGVKGDKPIVALSPGSTVAAKEWPAERYAEVARRLVMDGVDVILAGSGSETGTTEEVAALAQAPVIDLAGKSSIGQLAAVFQRCAVVVSNDTGPLHLAVGVGTPVVGIYGPTSPRRTGPYGELCVAFWDREECSPCGYSLKCEKDCFETVTVERIYAAVMGHLSCADSIVRPG